MDKEQITILLVQPGKRPVEKTIPHTLQDLQAQVGGTIEIVYPWSDRRVGLVCKDEGKLEGMPLNRAIPEIEDAIAGDFFLCGLCDTEEGDDLCSLASEDMEYMKEHFKDPHFFMQTKRGIVFFRVTPAVYEDLMGRPKKSPPHDYRER